MYVHYGTYITVSTLRYLHYGTYTTVRTLRYVHYGTRYVHYGLRYEFKPSTVAVRTFCTSATREIRDSTGQFFNKIGHGGRGLG